MKMFLVLFFSLLMILAMGRPALQATQESRHKEWKISKKQQAFLDSLEHATFRFFWETANPKNGLIPDSYPDTEFSSVAGVGFALTSYLVGVENHYITRARAAERTLATLTFLMEAPQSNAPSGAAGYHGFFYHFLDMQSGLRYDQSELSTIDTALLMAGVLSSKNYFSGENEVEARIRAYADSLYRRVDWPWAYSRIHKPLLSLGWTPEEGFITYDWAGYSEGMILYLLAMGSPTHPIDADAWQRWTSTYKWDDFYGFPYVNFGPLFGHQYSHVWIDFRGIQDAYMREKGIDYFINSRLAAYASRAYSIANPDRWRGYGDMVWGLTASNGPGKATAQEDKNCVFHAYWARGSCAGYTRDDGTIAPTAVGGMVPFAPEITLPTLEYFYSHFGERLYGKYGFKDAFNLSYQSDSSEKGGWFDKHYLAIDEGPILLMIENYRTAFIWDLMKKDGYIRKGLETAGFRGGWLNKS